MATVVMLVITLTAAGRAWATAEVAAQPGGAQAQSAFDAGALKSKVAKMAEMNREIFFAEQLGAMKAGDREKSEARLNSMYREREAIAAELAKECTGADAAKKIRAVKAELLNSRLYDAAGFDSLVNRLPVPEGDGDQAARDGILEMRSFVQHESTMLESPVSYSDELAKRFLKATSAAGETQAQAGESGAPSSAASDPLEKYSDLLVMDPVELGPKPGGGGAAIDGPVSVKFDAEKIQKSGRNIEVAVSSAAVRPKFPSKPGQDAGGKIDVRWDPATGAISMSHNAPLERGVMYSAVVKFEYPLPGNDKPKPQAGAQPGGAAQSGGGSSSGAQSGGTSAAGGQSGSSGASPSGQAPSSGQPGTQGNGQSGQQVPSGQTSGEGQQAGGAQPAAGDGPAFVRSRSVGDGLYKTTDIDFTKGKVICKLEWNFETKGYKAAPAVAPNDAAGTGEVQAGEKASGEVELKDKRDTAEGELKKAPGSGENLLKREPPADFGSVNDKIVPAVILRTPEGPGARRRSEIFVVFSCDMDPGYIRNDSMQLFAERSKGSFIPVTGEVEMVGRKLYFRPYEELAFVTNYMVAVNTVRSATKVVMPIAEKYFFRTAPGVTAVKLPHDGRVGLGDTFEITLSENIPDAKIRFLKCDNTRETELDFDICTRLVADASAAKPGVGKFALDSTGSALAPAPQSRPGDGSRVEAELTRNTKGADGRMTIEFRAKAPLVAGKHYKIDVYADSVFIDEGIIRFTAK